MIQTTIEARQAVLEKFINEPGLRTDPEWILSAVEDAAFYHRYDKPGSIRYATRDELAQLMLCWIEASSSEGRSDDDNPAA